MPDTTKRKKILVAPLNWGLGHASRCIPIIRALIDQGFQPVLASDGAALELLRQEFPSLECFELPSYDIRYSRRSEWMALKMLSQVPRARAVARREHQVVQRLIAKTGLQGIISDNRFGVYSSKVPSVYLTHQLKVLAGPMTPITSGVHARTIRCFDQCWVCDFSGAEALAGALSQNTGLSNVKYIGPLSRFQSDSGRKKEIDLCFVLSGPEPQRSSFQRLIEQAFMGNSGRMVLVEGVVNGKRRKRALGNLTVYNYLLTNELEALMQKSSLVVSRSGYSTVMDLYAMGARAFFVPTPGQSEQEYLADYLEGKGLVGYTKQKAFSSSSLENAENYRGFNKKETPNEDQFHGLFDVFR